MTIINDWLKEPINRLHYDLIEAIEGCAIGILEDLDLLTVEGLLEALENVFWEMEDE